MLMLIRSIIVIHRPGNKAIRCPNEGTVLRSLLRNRADEFVMGGQRKTLSGNKIRGYG
jgi:hypothetical protein